MAGFFSRILSVGSDKQLKEFRKIAGRVNELEPTVKAMDDDELKGQTARFKERYANGESLDSILPEAFATMREASWRTIGQRHFDVQLIGGIALHRGTIAEMKTGEGKTLVSTLAGYLNALAGEGVHIVTVNDYLAKRDSEWMGRIYRFMGMEAGLLQNGMNLNLKKPAYAADVTYGTNSEFGFDYLRDNMVTRASQRVQRGHYYAIVDEVDSILIDEARTPLIISGAGSKSATTYQDFAQAVRGLESEVDFEMDEAKHTIAATEDGLEKIEGRLGVDIYADMSGALVNHLQQALKAEYLFHRDQQYAVIDGEVKIVDEFTGRIMEGRRYSEGLHQAIEAKEGVIVREENQTLATITLQNYFRLYEKLSGMTGTAMTEDAEFREIYNLPVQVIPPNRPVIRKDNDDLVYRTIDAKFNAVAEEIVERHAKGQPCLVGTVSIENSEKLSKLLSSRGIHHAVLNAKFHEQEAQIVAQAGREGAVTIATNMAGRGTDILLGGNPQVMATDMIASMGINPAEAPEDLRADTRAKAQQICEDERKRVLAAGGLCVIGTERHESRRIDNQLRGRSGRQGDPGETQFYLSLEDDLMRLFGGDRMDKIGAMMQRYEMPDDMPIQAKMVTKAVEGAQRKVEEINFAMRKNVLEYDDVMNKQRRVIYEERNKILDGKDLTAHVNEVTHDTVWNKVAEFCPADVNPETWDLEGVTKWAADLTGHKEGAPTFTPEDDVQYISDAVEKFVHDCYQEKTANLGDDIMHELTTQVMLRVIDTRWMAYLQEMDYLKTGIGLRGFGQRDPLVEYKSEAYAAFSLLVNTMYEDFLRTILHIEFSGAPMRRAAAARSANEREAARISVSQDDGALKGASYSGPSENAGTGGASPTIVGGANAREGKQPVRIIRRTTTPETQAPTRSFSEVETAPDQAKRVPYRKANSLDPYANVGRNDPCPCGSGKKFKNCHGMNL